MIKTLQLKLVLLLCMIMGAGTAWADETDVLNSSDFQATGTSYINFSGVKKNTAVYAGRTSIQNSSVGMKRDNSNGCGIFTTTSGGTAKSLTFTWTSTSNRTLQVYGKNTAYSLDDTKNTATYGTLIGSVTYSANSTTPTITLNSDDNYEYIFITASSTSMLSIKDITIVWEVSSGTSPSISAENVDIAYNATSGSIAYTISNPVTGGAITSATVTSSTPSGWLTVTGSNPYSSPIGLTCEVNNTTSAKTATVQLTYTYNTDQTVTKNVTVTQAAAPLTTMDQIFAAATTAGTTATTQNIAFNNWVVTGVKNSNAYVTDGTKGFIVYASNHGFAVGNVLSGTASCKVQLYRGAAEITELTSSTTGLTVTTGGTVTAQEFSINNLSGVNTGAVITVNGVTYDGTNTVLKDASNNSIKPYNTLYSDMSFTNGQEYNVTGVYLQYNDTKEILPRSSNDIQTVVSNTPTIIASTSSLSGFTYEEGNGPSTAKTISVSGSNLTANITVALTSNSDFELSTNENSGYANSITLTQSSGTVAATTVYVRLKAGLVVANNYSDDITISSTGATDVTVSLAGSVTNAAAPHVTWDLSIDETATASENEMTWTSTYATMGVAKGSASTNTNNYYPGTSGQSYTSTRFYKNSNLTITPASGFAITSVVFTATTSGYATALQTSTWTNATASVDNTTVTVTPTDGNADISAVIGGTCGFTAVTVYYTTSSVVKYDITLSNNVENGSIAADKSKAQENETVTLTATPDANYELDSWTVSYGNSQTVNVTVDGSDANKATFIMPASDVTVSATFVSNVTLYTVNIDSNISNGSVSSDKSTAAENDEVTLTVTPASGYALDVLTVVSGSANVATTKVNSTTYKFTMPAGDVSVSATFAQFTGSTYTLATSLVSGKKYIIVGKDDQNNYYAMGEQRSNNRAGVGVTVSGTTATVSSSDVREFVIGGLAGSYTIFDDVEQGYLYAASSGSNYLRTQADNDENGEWTINFDDTNAEASVVANGTYTRNVMHFNPNNGSPIFSCYASTSTLGPVYFYVKDEAASSVTVTIKANFPATTFSTDKALDFTNVTDATAYIITDGNGTTAKVEKVPANTGLYIEAATIPTSNLEIVVPVYTGTEYSSTTDNKLIATTASTTYNSDNSTTYYAYGHYTGNNQDKYAFMKIGGNGLTPGAGKALLAIPTGNAKDIIDVNGGATSIDNLQWTIDNSEVNGIYDLQGRRVVAPTKGIYIVNGRKVVIK